MNIINIGTYEIGKPLGYFKLNKQYTQLKDNKDSLL